MAEPHNETERERAMTLYVGTSGYAYKEWKGRFYPQDLPAKGMLRYYGERFAAVEINNTFYRMPKPSVLEGWTADVPEGFRFALKASQRITHMQRLKGVEEPLKYLLDVSASLGARLGPLLVQLPPNLKKDSERLRAFLALLPAQRRVAFEFRHSSWFDDDVLRLLQERGCALCLAEAEDGVEAPLAATAGWGYLRLRRADYTDARLRAWLERVAGQPWQDVFVFFKHEDEAKGPRLAQRFLELAG